MKKAMIGSFAALTLALGACGGGGDGDQAKVADMMIEAASENGLELDKGCVEDAAAKLSDDDAKKLVDSDGEGDVELSAEGDALGEQMFEDCVDISSYISSIIDTFSEDGSVDADCLKEEFDGITTAAEVDEKMFDAAFACSN